MSETVFGMLDNFLLTRLEKEGYNREDAHTKLESVPKGSVGTRDKQELRRSIAEIRQGGDSNGNNYGKFTRHSTYK